MSLLSAKAHFFFFLLYYFVDNCLKIIFMHFSLKERDIMENRRRRREDMPLTSPNADGNVWPRQVCLAFEQREDTPNGIRQCWYCRCADFHLDKARSLDVGVCYWPKKVVK